MAISRVDDVNGFKVQVYERENPSVSGSHARAMPTGVSWRFHHWIYRNTAYLTNYVERKQSGHTTVYVGNHYEKVTTPGQESATKYYYFNGRRIATRKVGGSNPGLYYLLADHLGSTTAVVNSDGSNPRASAYLSFGSSRLSAANGLTDRLFTGQMLDSTGLYYYGARFYDPLLGRFVSPDSIVPDPANPQSLNRYSYVYNNPLRYTDPTGHCVFGLPCPQPVETTVSFVRGAATGFTDAMTWNTLDGPRQAAGVQEPENEAYLLGKITGDIVGTAAGGTITLAGAGIAVGGGAAGTIACVPTAGGGCAVAAGSVAGGSAVAGYGAGVTGTGYNNLQRDINQFNAKRQAGQGPSRRLPFNDHDRITEVNRTLDRIKNGTPKYVEDGARFGNREGRLPFQENKDYYSEWTVDTPGLSYRGQRRLIQGKGGEVYYTDDHYESFVKINPEVY